MTTLAGNIAVDTVALCMSFLDFASLSCCMSVSSVMLG